MSHDAKTQQILSFLEAQAEKYPAVAGELSQMTDLYTRKLWHQLTLLVGSVVAMEGAAPLLQPLYDTFIMDFKHKMNKLALARMQVAVARQMPDAERAFFCKTAADEISKEDRQASSYILCELARMHLDAGLVSECKERLDEAATFVEGAAGLENLVQAAYYRSWAAYYKVKGPAAEFYKHALLLLAYAPLSEVCHVVLVPGTTRGLTRARRAYGPLEPICPLRACRCHTDEQGRGSDDLLRPRHRCPGWRGAVQFW